MKPREATQNDSMRTTVRKLIDDCDSLLGDLSAEGSRRYRNTARSFNRHLQQTRDDLDDLHYSARRRARATMRRADTYVHENPWRTSASAAATGILVGALLVFLMTRR
jgi:ElaB/YqjD/DUF883 family membrane-anchored ribosome-binding protein